MQTDFLDSLTREYGNRLIGLYEVVESVRPNAEGMSTGDDNQLTLDGAISDYAAASGALMRFAE